jgi:hypothetical protein
MLVTVAVTMCQFLLTLPTAPVCRELIVTVSNQSQGLALDRLRCRGQAPLAKWKEENAVQRSQNYFIAGWKCAPGHYEVKERA